MNETQFQIHVTINNLSKDQLDKFIEVCKKNNVKPLYIILTEGKYINQPMFTKLIKNNNIKSVLDLLTETIDSFKYHNFDILRIKVEIPPEFDSLYNQKLDSSFQSYYEWHCKIIVENLKLIEKLCFDNQAHLSLNSLDGDLNSKYITIRNYKNKELFYKDVSAMSILLSKESINVIKEKFEYCIYDTRLELDKGWAS